MTHKMFTDSLTLLKQLRKRFCVLIPSNIFNSNNILQIKEFQINIQKPIQLKVIKALRYWMKYYWSQDFYKNKFMQLELEDWLNELYINNEANCIWISKLYSAVKKEYLRLKNINFDFQFASQMDILSSFNDINLNKNLNKMNIFLSKYSAEELADQ
eukprot:201073_1